MQIVSIITFLSSPGFKLLFRDANDVRRIKAKMFSDGVRFQDLSYREMEKLRQVGVGVGVGVSLLNVPQSTHTERTWHLTHIRAER